MRTKEKSSKGITLVALVITIIILLLLAGIAIATLGGENGLFAKVKQSKEKYSISEAKEKLELAISNLQIEQEGKGENLKKEDLTKMDGDEIDVRDISNFPVKVICNNYEFNIDSNFSVSYVGIANGTTITYTTEPEGYTNKNEVKILIKIKNSKGIKTIEYPNDNDKLLANGQTEIGIDYKVTANGMYTFKIVDNDNNEITKDIVIDKIDTVEPKDFTPGVENIQANSFTIVANAEDGDATDISTKSGIGRYEYFVKEIDSDNYNKYETKDDKYEVIDLKEGTDYKIYVIAYDKANNSKKSTEISVQTKIKPRQIYIDNENGDDINGDGTQEKPYKTLSKITNEGIVSYGYDYEVYLGDGEYKYVDSLISLNNPKSLKIFGNKENTIINYGEDLTGAISQGYSLNFYRLIFNVIEKQTNESFASINNFYNVIINLNYEDASPSLFMTQGHIFNFINCTVPIKTSNLLRQCYGGEIHLTNCYGGFSTSVYGINANWDFQTNYITSIPQVDSTTYRITEDESKWKNIGTGTNLDGTQANLGVYGGEYSWEN